MGVDFTRVARPIIALNRKKTHSHLWYSMFHKISTWFGCDLTLKNYKLSWCQLCHHWWHRRLSLRQPPVLPVRTKLAILSEAVQVVIMTTSGAASEDKVGIITTLMTTSGAASEDKVGIITTLKSPYFCCGHIMNFNQIYTIILLILFRVISLALGQSFDSPSSIEVTLYLWVISGTQNGVMNAW